MAFDQDFVAIQGVWASRLDSNARFNGYMDNYNNGSQSNGDEAKWTRFFTKGGLYKVRFVHVKNASSAKIDIGLDSSTNNVFSQIDSYTGGTTFNFVNETTLEISRGYHDIHIKANGKNVSSAGYEIFCQVLQFDLIQEYPLYKDDQTPRTMPTKGFQRPALQFAALAADYTTTTTANDVSTGTGVTISSPHTDKILIKLATIVKNGTINDGATVKIYRSTSSIPAQGSASGVSDTVVYSTTVTEVVAAEQVGIPACFVDSGLTPGITYYYYITIKAVTGGTVTIQGGTNQTTITAEPV